jgi:broad specificity phosphatase PhoE
MTTTQIHVVRHAEVENPDNVWYGLLEGFPLSEQGRQTAEALARHFASHPLAAVYSSPLTRAMETAEPIARTHGLEIVTCPDIIETQSFLQGQPANRRVFRKVANLRYFVNPFRPTWGEPYRNVAARMVRAIDAMRAAHPGGEVVAVSHMTPIMVARVAVEGRALRPWLAGIHCARGSVTTLIYEDGNYARTEYVELSSSSVTKPDPAAS